MTNTTKSNFRTKLKQIFWPIEWHENKKFIPMALMMSCILYNYSTLRSIKDSLVVTHIGTEALGFIKTYVVVPSAIITMIIYAKLCNMFSAQKIFYIITSFFLVFFAIFTFVLYPNPDMFHIAPASLENMITLYPNFKWFIKIAANWSYAAFYTMSELWGSVMLTLLFWQFANQITKTDEAKRFYSMFGLLGNAALPLVGFALLMNQKLDIAPANAELMPILCIVLFNGCMTMLLYRWINLHVLTDPVLYDPTLVKTKKAKIKLGLLDSVKMIFSSKYLLLITILVLSYGLSINLIESVWKEKIKALYSTESSYAAYMGIFQAYQGLTAIIFMLVGSNILRRVSWATAASFTPMMILITGSTFFAFIIFHNTLALTVAAFLGTGPIAMIVVIGMIQNILSKSVKYSLFDSTKEMSYIPLSNEMKTKGKAAVDVIGGRMGKSLGGIITSTIFILFPSYSFDEATPFLAAIFFVIVIIWIFAVRALSIEYKRKLNETN